jgi:uncharacterized protein
MDLRPAAASAGPACDNITRTGLRYDNEYCVVWRIENGKVRETREYCDSAQTEKALGKFPSSISAAS